MKRDLLYNCLPSPIVYADTLDKTDIHQAKMAEHLGLLIEYIKVASMETDQPPRALLAKRTITFDLLWAFFKPGATLCTTCPGTDKPCGIIYDYGGTAKNPQDEEFFKLVGTHLDYDCKVFGQVQATVKIAKFPGELPINQLAAFPLEYHQEKEKITANLPRMRLQNKISVFDVWSGESYDNFTDKVMFTNKGPSDLSDDDLLISPPTVLGFGLDDKLWGEFAIDNIREIQWSQGIFDKLVLSQDRKEVIMAVTERHIGEGRDKSFDDFIRGKGRGLIVLLSGPPGVGKTLTAEALAEHCRRPLYRVCSQLLASVCLDAELSQIFTTVHHWRAILRMDEADVFLTERSSRSLRDLRVSCMLDKTIESRVHLSIAYRDLDIGARKTVFRQLLERSQNDVEEKELNALVGVKVNGREIKNYISIALAIKEWKKDDVLSYRHIRSAYSSNGHLLPDPNCERIEVSLYD
ncbi:hypothetical protein ACJ73_00915 [Blastomyces percursus]|uniref:AAA+ ATPase domain-containing protein n=1 Tax=Blastomyces percursus TaxID=1658174 RepID=A0A1J9RGJ9_9EURO|nr:hypothetical protein ACJ73_00915 [Blastomyces percursus]